jgi:high-affinity iron transporter
MLLEPNATGLINMLESFVITLREGLEAFLIVAISLAYLKKTNRPHLVSAVHWGIGISIAASIGAGLLLQRASNQPLWEGILALVAAVLVATLIVHMWRTGKRMKRSIEGRLETAALKTGRAAFLGTLGFTVLMISREGMETALLMNTLIFQMGVGNLPLITGAIGGILAAASVAWLWSRYGHRVNLGQFFQVTAVFLFVFVISLSIAGFHELTEANIGIPNSEALHWATEPYGPDGVYGHYLTYMMVLLPIGWLLIANVVGRRTHTQVAR